MRALPRVIRSGVALARLVPLALAAVLGAAACEKPPIEWSDPGAIAQPAGATTLVVDSSGHARFTAADAGVAGQPVDPGLCVTSLRFARGLHQVLAGWWAVRPDSSAVLRVASSPDSGRTWGNARSVDTTDVSSNGCTRPPPAVTAVGDDVYVAYSMIAPEGKGVFFAHSMGSMLHSPVPVIYGERLVATAIAADEWRVVVAYEEPNGPEARVYAALSQTMGHIFELHAAASRDVDEAVAPAVALAGKTIAVSWRSRSRSGATSSRSVRIGRLP